MVRPSRRVALGAIAALLLAVSIMLASACGGDADSAVRTVTVTAADVEDAPDASATEEGTAEADDAAEATTEAASDGTEERDGRTALNRTVGKDGRDGNVTFRVTGIKRQASVPTTFDTIRAPKGANLFVVTVIIRNDGNVKIDPFCGNTGILLLDQDGRNFEPVDNSYSIEGNETCSGVQPGFRSTERMAFALPSGARPAHVGLWDSNDENDDYSIKTYVRVAL